MLKRRSFLLPEGGLQYLPIGVILYSSISEIKVRRGDDRMINWFIFGFTLGIIFISYLLANIVGISYLLDYIFNIHKTEQVIFFKLYKKYFNQDVIDDKLGYNKIKGKELNNILLNSIKAQYVDLSLEERNFEKERLQTRLKIVREYTQRGFWTLTIIIGTITLSTLIVIWATGKKGLLNDSFLLSQVIGWGLKIIGILYVGWILEIIIKDRMITKQSIEIAFYKICLHILNSQ